MLYKAVNNALSKGMRIEEVTDILKKCGYELVVGMRVDRDMLELMFETPEEFDNDCHAAKPMPIDGAEFFDMAERRVGVSYTGTIRKLWNPNFVSAMALLGSPLDKV